MFAEQMNGLVAWGVFVPDLPDAPPETQEAIVALREALTTASFGFSKEPLRLSGSGFRQSSVGCGNPIYRLKTPTAIIRSFGHNRTLVAFAP